MSYTPAVNAQTLTLYLGIAGTGRATASSTTLDMVSFGTLYNPRAGITFEPSDVGMPIAIVGGGPVDADMPPINFVQGALFHTTIAAYVSPTEVTLTDAPDTSIFNTGFATVILYRPCPFASDVANVPTQFQYSSSIAPGTNDTLQFSVLNSLGGALGERNLYVDRFGPLLLGQPVYLHSSDSSVGDIFGGLIDMLTTSSMPGVSGPYCWSVQCASWSVLARRRVVPPAQPQTFADTGDVVFRKVVLTYLQDDGVAVTAATAPTIGLAAAVGANIGQLLDQVVSLCSSDVTAWYWTTDAWRTFILATRTGTAAPWSVTNGDDLLAGGTPYQQSLTQSHNQMANTSYAIGNETILNTLNVTLKGNGTATTFNLPQDVGAEPTITLNTASQTVGILGVDTGKDWYWSQDSAVITQDTGGTVLGITDTLVVTYAPLVAAVASAPNVAGLQSAQAVEGTSGVYSHATSITQPVLPADLLAIATAYELEYGLPAATCQFYTLRPGLATGQIQSITLADAGIPSGDYLIATLQMTLLNNVIVWQYTAFGGANIGDSITALTQFINRDQATLSIVTPVVPITGAAASVSGNFASGRAGVGGSPALGFPAPVTAGNLLVAVVTRNNLSGEVVTDSQGNTYTLAVTASNGGTFPNRAAIFYAIAGTSGACSVTCSAAFYIAIAEVAGIDPISPLDSTASNSGSAPAITVAKIGNVVITGMCMDSSTSGPTATPPEIVFGYSLTGGPSSDCAGALDIRTAAGSFTSTLANSAGDPIYVSASFTAASSTPAPQTTDVVGNAAGTVTNSSGALTANLPVLGNGGADVKIGVAGQLVPSGGTTGQVLAKSSGTNYDTGWVPAGGLSVTTKGDLQGYSTVPARVAVGTDGDVLTADSAATTGVSWQPGGGGGGGGLVLLAAMTASNSTSLDFTGFITSTYDTYVVEMTSLLPVSGGNFLRLVVSTNGGSSYDTSSIYEYACTFSYPGGSGQGSSSGSDTAISLMGSNWGNGTMGGSGTLKIFDPLNGTLDTGVAYDTQYFHDGVNQTLHINGGGRYKSSTAVNAFRLICSSGNIASGTVRLYGLEK